MSVRKKMAGCEASMMVSGRDSDDGNRKGINNLVLEKFNTLRASGAAIGVYINGWRALDQLGVGMELRRKAIPLTEYVSLSFGTLKRLTNTFLNTV
ncbi:hypothetical protein COCNU_scaffold014605G000050 [Cocos nucifera]|nr:hypothetical protein [Cocos nucifera]